jgi:hypothetical protein
MHQWQHYMLTAETNENQKNEIGAESDVKPKLSRFALPSVRNDGVRNQHAKLFHWLQFDNRNEKVSGLSLHLLPQQQLVLASWLLRRGVVQCTQQVLICSRQGGGQRAPARTGDSNALFSILRPRGLG